MDSTISAGLPKLTTSEAAIPVAASQSIMGTIHHSSIPLLVNEDSNEETKNQPHVIIKALHLTQVIYLVFAGIVALLFAIQSIVAFAVLMVAFVCYFGLFWYNAASSVRTRENAIALIIRSFSVAAVLATSAQSFVHDAFYFPSELFIMYGTMNVHDAFYFPSELFIIYRTMNVLLLLGVSFLDWRWNGLMS